MPRAFLIASLLFGCSASSTGAGVAAEVETTELEGEARVAAQEELRALARAHDLQDCVDDTDCVPSRFHDCCADAEGASDCEWWAVRADQIQRRQDECAVEECIDHATAQCADTAEVPGEARCAIYRIGDYVEGVCKLR